MGNPNRRAPRQNLPLDECLKHYWVSSTTEKPDTSTNPTSVTGSNKYLASATSRPARSSKHCTPNLAPHASRPKPPCSEPAVFEKPKCWDAVSDWLDHLLNETEFDQMERINIDEWETSEEVANLRDLKLGQDSHGVHTRRPEGKYAEFRFLHVPKPSGSLQVRAMISCRRLQLKQQHTEEIKWQRAERERAKKEEARKAKC